MNYDGEKVVPLFRTIQEILADEATIIAEYEQEWAEACRKFDVAKALMDGDQAELAKFTFDEIKLAKSDAKGTRDEQLIAAGWALVKARIAADEKVRARLYGMSKVARRSMRFASARQHDGGAA